MPSVAAAVSVTIEELKQILTTLPPETAVMVWGPPGVGKTAAVRQSAAASGALCYEEILSTKAPEDLEGVPFPVERDGGRFTLFAPPLRLAELVERDGPPAFFFMDELNTAQPHIQVLAMQIALEKRIGACQFRDNVRIVAAGNRAADRAAVNLMPKPLQNRFEHYEVVVDVDVWVRWAYENGIDPAIIGFVRANPARLHNFNPDAASPAFATPRSYEMANRRLQVCGWDHPLVGKMLGGCIGEGVALELVAFRRLQAELPDPQEILRDGREAPLPPFTKPDRRYFILTSLTVELLRAPSAERMRQALYYVMRMDADLGAKFVRDIAMGPGAARQHLIGSLRDEAVQRHYREKWAHIFDLVTGVSA